MRDKGVKHYVIVTNIMSKINNWGRTDKGSNV